MTRQHAAMSGFTLVELAIVLIIVALLTGGMLMSLSAQQENSARKENEQRMAAIQEALMGFAAANGRLPCPDTDLDGAENRQSNPVQNNTPDMGKSTVTTICSNVEGGIPFQDLGITRSDFWGSRFRYRVTGDFAKTEKIYDSLGGSGNLIATNHFTLSTPGDIIINQRGDNPGTAGIIEQKFPVALTTKAAAVVISHGPNRMGSITEDGVNMPAPNANSDELINATNGTTKYSRIRTPASDTCDDGSEGVAFCEFDDIVVWLSPNILYSRMIAAGRLP